MIVWRLCRKPYAAFDGEGARLYGGRWTRPGLPVVYTAASAALAMAEYLVHLEPREAPRDLVLVAADIPAGLTVASVKVGDLPSRWRQYPAPEGLARIGARWFEQGKTAILRVPSAVVPQELNYLLNPRHSDFRRISLRRPEPFAFDPRLRR